MFKGSFKKTLSKMSNVIMAGIVLAMPAITMATDYAASAKQDVKDTFGPGSTAWYIIMVMEVLAASFVFIKTKNLGVFGGVVALMLFGNVAFGLF